MPQRNFKFYTELVLVTVLSLISATLWVRWITHSLNKYYPDSPTVDFITSVIVTLIAIFVLNWAFGKQGNTLNSVIDKDDEKRELKRKRSIHPLYEMDDNE